MEYCEKTASTQIHKLLSDSKVKDVIVKAFETIKSNDCDVVVEMTDVATAINEYRMYLSGMNEYISLVFEDATTDSSAIISKINSIVKNDISFIPSIFKKGEMDLPCAVNQIVALVDFVKEAKEYDDNIVMLTVEKDKHSANERIDIKEKCIEMYCTSVKRFTECVIDSAKENILSLTKIMTEGKPEQPVARPVMF